MASTSARLKRMAADCSMAARVCERSPCSERSSDSTTGASTLTAPTTSPRPSRSGAMPDTQTPKSSAFRTLATKPSPASTRASSSSGSHGSPQRENWLSVSPVSSTVMHWSPRRAKLVTKRTGGCSSRKRRSAATIVR